MASRLKELLDSSRHERRLWQRVHEARGVVLLGAGHEMHLCREMLLRYGVIPDACCEWPPATDGAPAPEAKQGDLPVMSAHEALAATREGRLICIASRRTRGILEWLDAENCSQWVNLSGMSEAHPDFFSVDFLVKHEDALARTAALWADARSIALFYELLHYRLHMTCDATLWREDFPQYFHPLAAPRAADVILDGGAYIGDTALRFCEFLRRNCEVHAFEPEPRNFARMYEWVQREHMAECVFPVAAGLSDRSGSLFLQLSDDQEFSGSHRLAPGGALPVPVVAVDDYVQAHGLKPSFLKLDVEGGELGALRGAERTLREFKPRLAVCLYHQPADLWEIPLRLAQLQLGYSFFLGHHDPAPTETVLYAACD